MPNQSYLAHYGILGMKWGIRRSPEELGHPRSRKKYPRKNSDISQMSDNELNNKINRIQKERQYKTLTQNPVVTFGKAALKTIVVASAFEITKEIVKAKMKSGIDFLNTAKMAQEMSAITTGIKW